MSATDTPQTCRACHAEVVWATTEKGKPMILDAKPQRLYVIGDDGVCRFVKAYTPHWGTCPHADQFKRKES